MALVQPPRPATLVVSRMPMRPAWIAFLVGGSAIAAGAGLVVAWYTGFVGRSREVPDWLLGWVGLLFAGAGLYLVAQARVDLLWRRRPASRLAAWKRDHPWPLRFVTDDGARAVKQQIAGVVLMGALLVPLHFAFVAATGIGSVSAVFRRALWLPVVVLVLFDVLWVAAAVSLGRRLAQLARFARSRLVFESGPPFLTGRDMVCRLDLPRSTAGARDCHATLRCVQERIREVRGSRHHEALLLFEDTQRIDLDSGARARVRFTIPPDAPPTDFAGVAFCYWELIARAVLAGVDFEATFLVPVYATDA